MKRPLTSLSSLKDFQAYVAEMYQERGFEGQSVSEQFHLLLEELGEFARSTRKAAGIGTRRPDKQVDEGLSLEAADVFIYLLGLCNTLDIDLESAFKEKEEINDRRVWKSTP